VLIKKIREFLNIDERQGYHGQLRSTISWLGILQGKGIDFGGVRGISGAGQQHGSVY